LPVVRLADFVDVADVVMVESWGGLGLVDEAHLRFIITCKFRWKELERDGALEAAVFGLVDNTHPSAAELLDDSVVRNSLANHCDRLRQKDGGSSKFRLLTKSVRREIWDTPPPPRRSRILK